PNEELAESFFNSLTRRIFHTIGVDPQIEFVVPASPYVGGFQRPWSFAVRFERNGGDERLYADMLEHFRFAVDYDDPGGAAVAIAHAVREQLPGVRVEAL